MTGTPQTRRSSVYTIRCSSEADAAQVADALDALEVPINDRGDAAVSWRTTDDATAMATAVAATASIQSPHRLTTGLGIHRRTVEGPA